MNSIRRQCLAATASAVVLCSSPALAQQTDEPEGSTTAEQRARVSFIDLTAGLGYATNPFLRFGDSTGSGFGRLGVRGLHSWMTERTRTSLTGYVEGSTYLHDYNLKSIFSVSGDTQHRASETVTVFASAGLSGDLVGAAQQPFPLCPAGAGGSRRHRSAASGHGSGSRPLFVRRAAVSRIRPRRRFVRIGRTFERHGFRRRVASLVHRRLAQRLHNHVRQRRLQPHAVPAHDRWIQCRRQSHRNMITRATTRRSSLRPPTSGPR